MIIWYFPNRFFFNFWLVTYIFNVQCCNYILLKMWKLFYELKLKFKCTHVLQTKKSSFSSTFCIHLPCKYLIRRNTFLTLKCLVCIKVYELQKFDPKIRRGHQKNFLWASRLWVGRRKEPILGYVLNNDEKNLALKG